MLHLQPTVRPVQGGRKPAQTGAQTRTEIDLPGSFLGRGKVVAKEVGLTRPPTGRIERGVMPSHPQTVTFLIETQPIASVPSFAGFGSTDLLTRSIACTSSAPCC
jgi:hypothetical protein